MSPADLLPLHLGSKAQGTVRVPGSKSLSNRLLLLAAVASGETTLTHLLDSDDIQRMRDALAALGVETEGRRFENPHPQQQQWRVRAEDGGDFF